MRETAGTTEMLERIRGARMTPGICYICPWTCPTEVFTRGGRVVYVRGNTRTSTKGSRCVKGEASHVIAHDDKRLKSPMRRTGPNRYEPITWDRALGEIANALARIKATSGPEAVVYLRHLDANGAFAQAFFSECYGTPNYYGHTAACEQDRRLAALTVLGHFFPVHDYEHAKFIMLLGINMLGANQSLYESRGVLAAVSKGATLVVVDPAFTATAAKATEWIPIAPGTDGALLFAMAHVIVEERLYDEPFCRQWTHGFEEFCQHVVGRGYTPEWAEKITDVSAATIRRLARDFASTRPAMIETFKGLGNYANGLDASRLVYILNALAGQIDGPGNLILKEWAPLRPPVVIPPDRKTVPARPPLHVAMGYPLAPDLPTQLLPQAILEGTPYPVRGVFFQFTNPVMSEPNTDLFRRAVQGLELSVAIDTHLGETAAECQYVLPEASFYERADVRQSLAMPPEAALCAPALAPYHEARPLYEIIRGLAERMGYGDLFRWDSWKDWAQRVVRSLPTDLQTMTRTGVWSGELRYHKFTERGFATPSGKIELKSEAFAKHGYNALPEYRDRDVIPDAAFPFQLINSKFDTHCNLTTQDNPILLRICGENWAEINTRDAEGLGIQDGDRIEIASPQGAVTIQAKVRAGIRPSVVCVRHGHGFGHWQGLARGRGTHINPIIGTNVNPISGGIGYNECKVRIRKM